MNGPKSAIPLETSGSSNIKLACTKYAGSFQARSPFEQQFSTELPLEISNIIHGKRKSDAYQVDQANTTPLTLTDRIPRE